MLRRIVSTLLIGCALLAGCAAPPYGPPTTTDKRLELRTDMHELWHYLIELDHALAPPPKQQDVQFALGELRRVAGAIDVEQAARLHAFFPAQLDDFRATLKIASAAAADSPPDYRSSLQVVDACGRCHLVRKDE